jgi:hypothetical protein
MIRFLLCLAAALAVAMFTAMPAHAQATFGEGEAVTVEAEAPAAAPTMATPEGRRSVFRGLIQLRRAGVNFRGLVHSAQAVEEAGQELNGKNIVLQWAGTEASQEELEGVFDDFTIEDLIALIEVILPFIMLFL